MEKNKQDNPLPGYLDEWDDHNYSVFRDHYILMIRGYYEKNGTAIVSAIEDDAVFVPHCDSRVFSLNEMSFELRTARRRHTVEQENSIRTKWVKRVISDSGQDAGLDFLSFLLDSRQKREKIKEDTSDYPE